MTLASGMPVLAQPLYVHVGQDLKELLERDPQLESSTLPALKQGVTLCLEQGDTGRRELHEHLTVEGEEHIEWVETQPHLSNAVVMTGDRPYLLPRLRPEPPGVWRLSQV
jgi:bacterioferritin